MLLGVVGLLGLKAQDNPTHMVIPSPASWTEGQGDFPLSWNLVIYCQNPAIIPSVKVFTGYLYSRSGIVATVLVGKPRLANGSIYVETVEGAAPESYYMEILPRQVNIKGSAQGGVFYGLISFLQSMYYQRGTWMVRCGVMSDLPRFQYRGMHLDVARHFVTLDSVKRYLDFMALYKFNTFHWHLTDDQGWRIEIKKYPELTQRGSWRDHTQKLKSKSMPGGIEMKGHGGYYSQDQVRQIVQYALERNIQIIPEIEMPGHSVAAQVAYPYLSCKANHRAVPGTWGIFEDVLCMREETFQWVDGVLQEVATLFPSSYIHIGGDECPSIRWGECGRCKKVMERENIYNAADLQGYFTSRVRQTAQKYGKKVIAWDEVLDNARDTQLTIMNWRDSSIVTRAIQNHIPVILSPLSHCYFDHYQGDPTIEPLAHGGFTPIEKVYSFSPDRYISDSSQFSYILGGQGNVWTEYMPSFSHIEYMALPRMCALSEVLWSKPEYKSWPQFQSRLQHQMNILDHWRVNYSRSLFAVGWKLEEDSLHRGIWFHVTHTSQAYMEIQRGKEKFAKIYKYPELIRTASQIKAWQGGPVPGPIIEKYIVPTYALKSKVQWVTPPDPPHIGSGTFTLKDGYVSSIFKDWVGFQGKDAIWEVTPGKNDTIFGMSLAFLSDPDSWIHLPGRILVYHVEDYRTTLVSELEWVDSLKKGITWMQIPLPQRTYKKLKVMAESRGKIPQGLPGAGNHGWIFCGEMRINE